MMARNLDLTALRAFMVVADTGSVTRSAALLNLTQSAVSMQIKRLEEGLAKTFFFRSARRLTLTPEGEQLLAYARRMLQLNDEILSRLTDTAFDIELRLGVPSDIVYPAIPMVLQRLAAAYPCARINLVSCFTPLLKEEFARGEYDLILTTEEAPSEGGEVLDERPLVWIGARGASAWQRRPLRLAFEESCKFRAVSLAALDRAGIPWEMGFAGRSIDAIHSMIAADLAISSRMRGLMPEGTEEIDSGGALPPLGTMRICLYDAGVQKGEVIERLKAEIVSAYTVAGRSTTVPVDFRLRRRADQANAIAGS
jgi:DNA-binding transcriptional LysR family regulator